MHASARCRCVSVGQAGEDCREQGFCAGVCTPCVELYRHIKCRSPGCAPLLQDAAAEVDAKRAELAEAQAALAAGGQGNDALLARIESLQSQMEAAKASWG